MTVDDGRLTIVNGGCHSERSEESALVRLEPKLQILRFAQDDRAFGLQANNQL
jgi:hypothetical protein